MNAAAKHLDAGLQLGDRRSRDLRAAADAAEFGMDLTMGLPALASVEADETVEQLALLTVSDARGTLSWCIEPVSLPAGVPDAAGR